MLPVRMEAPAYINTINESQFQRLVTETATVYGWLCVHFRQMVGNPSGWPDLIMFAEHRPTILAELKTEKGKVSPKQQEWHDNLRAHGAIVYVWRPSDYDDIVAELAGL